MKKNTSVQVDIIPYGLRQEETIIQIAVSLNHLDQVVDNVFQQFKLNMDKRKRTLLHLQQRTVALKNKVTILTGKNVVTTVYADSKYPAVKEEFERILQVSPTDINNLHNPNVHSKFVPYKYYKFSNKLQFFHVKNTAAHHENKDVTKPQGLGNLPMDLESVNSLILFNTTKNVYKEYVQLDPLDITVKQQQPIVDNMENTKTIAAAPNSMLNNYFVKNNDYFNCFYTPAFQQVPSIDVPQDLPDLPGVAGDLKFFCDTEKLIAPTVSSNETSESWTPTIPKPPCDYSNVLLEECNETNLNAPMNIDSISSSSPVIVEMPSLEKSNISSALDNIKPQISQIPSKMSPPPPPPPLPPPPPPLPQDMFLLVVSNEQSVLTNIENHSHSKESTKLQKNEKPLTASFDVHANLMEAIRKAGGKERAKLRPVADDKKEDDAISTKENVNGSFMADLYAKLALRRKGISGQLKDNKKASVLDQMSAMISSSPPDESDTDNDDGNDNEWED